MSLVSTPTYPVVGDTVELSLTVTIGSFFVYELTSVPNKSELETGLLTNPGAPSTLTSPAALAESGFAAQSFTPDVPGSYLITAYEYKQFYSLGGRWEFSQTQTGTVDVGDLLELPIVTKSGDGGTLKLTIVNNTVRAAEIASFTTERGRLASLTTATQAAVSALVGNTTSGIANELSTDVNNLADKYALHIANSGGTYHRNGSNSATPDTTNTLSRYDGSSQSEAINLLNDVHGKLKGHLLATRSVTSANRWHKQQDDGYDEATLVISTAGTESAATVLSAWTRYLYTQHIARTNPDSLEIHNVADSTNTLSSSSLLETLIVQYLKDVASKTISSVSGENLGAIRLTRLHGFRIA